MDKNVTKFVPIEDDREAARLLGPNDIPQVADGAAQNLAVKKQEGGQGLVLGGGGHFVVDCETGEKGVDVGFSGVDEKAGGDESGEAVEPRHVRLLGAGAVVANLEGLKIGGPKVPGRSGDHGNSPGHRGDRGGCGNPGKGRPQAQDGGLVPGNGPGLFILVPEAAGKRGGEGAKPRDGVSGGRVQNEGEASDGSLPEGKGGGGWEGRGWWVWLERVLALDGGNFHPGESGGSDRATGLGESFPEAFQGFREKRDDPNLFVPFPPSARDRPDEGPKASEILVGSWGSADSESPVGSVGDGESQSVPSSVVKETMPNPSILGGATRAWRGRHSVTTMGWMAKRPGE